LEEEALLQNIEEKPVCPGCGRPIKDDWQVCPYCHTKLRKPCVNCGQMLELSWNLCPYCASSQVQSGVARQPSRRRSVAAQLGSEPTPPPAFEPAEQETVEFVDDDTY
jgi:RNA polymerase subunit RPABC4/transcription elongation factor Spt4